MVQAVSSRNLFQPAIKLISFRFSALGSPNRVQKSAISKRYTDTKAHSSDKTHTAEQLAADYLKALKDHLIATLGRELGDIQAREIPLEFFITVPAVWTDLAKEKTFTAAKKAGLGDDALFYMISEPVSLLSS